MTATADFLARNALLVLLGLAALAAVAAALLWKLLAAFAPVIWKGAVAIWEFIRTLAIARRVRKARMIGPALAGALTVTRYLGIIAVVGFLVAGGAIVAFFEVAEEIGAGESLAEFDVALSQALHEHASRDLLRFFSIITHLGDFEFLGALTAIVLAVLLIRRQRALALAWLVATTTGGLLNRVLKSIFERTRPVHDHGFVLETDWSFPSGHASGAMLIYGLLAYLLVRRAPHGVRPLIASAAVLLIVFVGASRIVLQVHYLSDVLAGYLVSAAWVALWIAALEAARRRGAVAAARDGL